MKFNTTHTKGGYKILSLHGPDECEEYAGVVDTGGSYLTITWYDTGVPVSANELYSLIPLDEPKPDHKIEARLETLEERLDNLVAHHKHTESFAADVWQRLNHFEDGLSKRVEALEKDTDGTVTNLFDRVNQVEYDLTSVRDQLQRTNFARRIETLEQFKQEMLKPLSQPTDKGVWVTRKTLIDAYLKTSNINDLAKRLGLEE